MQKKLLLVLTSALCILPVFASYNQRNIPDSSEIRRTLVDSWFNADATEVLQKTHEIRSNEIGIDFDIRSEKRGESFAIIVAPKIKQKITMHSESGEEELDVDSYPETSAGSWILFRSKSSGKAERIVWRFNADSEVYIQFRPSANKTFADLIVFDACLARSVPVGIKFSRLYTASFSDVRRWTEKSIPWDKVDVLTGQYEEVLYMAGVIREQLNRIDYSDDACYNEKGKLYSIKNNKPLEKGIDIEGNVFALNEDRLTLSGAGFVKYVIDGIVTPLTGRGTKIEELVSPTVNFDSLGRSGVVSQNWNLTFTLDWVRNLASSAMNVRSSRDYTFETGGIDVTIQPFVSTLTDKGLSNDTGYIHNTGYSIGNLLPILYVLAVTEPDWFYLGAIRQESDVAGSSGTKLMAFNNSAVLFPYFDAGGKFKCLIFEMNKEVALSDFINNYSSSYIHLERVKSADFFYPQ